MIDHTNAGETATSGPLQIPFLVGERVRVSVTVDRLKTMQEGHGGWNQKMAEVLLQSQMDCVFVIIFCLFRLLIKLE